jgi:hypothetical protein
MTILGGLFLLACHAHAQIAFRASTSAASAATATPTYVASDTSTVSGSSMTINRPAGVAQDDILIAQITVKGTQTITPPSGASAWTLIDSSTSGTGGNEITQAVYWRLVGVLASEPGSYTWSWSSSDRATGGIGVFRDVDTADPIDVSGVRINDGSSTVTLPTLTTSSANAMLVALLGSSRAGNNHGAATGMTEAYELNSGAGPNGTNSSMDSLVQASAGSTGVKTATSSSAVDNIAHLIALRASGASLTLAVPPGTAADDVLIASIAVTPSGVTVTPPTGWTITLDTPNGSATSSRLVTLYRVASGAEPASYTFGLAGTAHAGAVGVMAGFSGVDTAAPINVQGANVTASALTHSANAITTTVANAMLVGAFEFASAPAAANFNPSGGQGMTKAAAQPSVTPANNAGVALVLSYGLQAAAASSGAKSAAASGVTADRGAAQLLALRPVVTLTHYRISVLSSTVANCDYAEVTITGHDATETPVAPPSGRSLNITMAPASGVWQVGTVAGTGSWTPSGANNGQANYIWPGGEQSFTVRLRQNTVATLNINLNDGSVAESATEDPSISFVNSAFRISNGGNAPLSIGTQIAGKPSNSGFGAQSLYLQAVRTDTTTGACVSLFPINTDVAVQVGAVCNNPASCARNVTLSSSALSGNTASFVPNGAYPASMNFRFTTANAEAPFALNYADAGQLTLQFRYQLASPPAGQFVQGSSNAFVVRPFGIAFSGMGHANNATGSLFAAAGDNFSMSLTAYQWASGEDADNDGVPDGNVNLTNNGTTPNFAATATISATSNSAGIAGSVSRGATCATTPATIALAGGTATANDWCYSEVGNVLLSATASNYLGSGQSVSGNSGLDGNANGPYVGRFRPKRFAVSNVTLGTRSDLACAPASTFTYMDETLRLGLRLTAQNAQGATTQNYTGASYAKLGVGTFANWNFGARSGTTNLSPRIDAGVAPTGSWSNGVADMTFTTSILRATPDNPDGPFPALQLGIAPVDSDTTAMDTLDLDVDNSGANDHKNLGLTADVRFGRLRLDNALGGEARRLPVSMRVEYWDGSGFKTNDDDDCTSIPRSAIALAFTPPSNLAACETAVDAATLTFADGVAPLALAAPGATNSGSVVLTVNLGSAAGTYCPAPGGATAAATSVAMPYLLGRWNDGANPDGNANTTYDDKPSARAAFGLYGSQPGNFIYFRERY